MRKLLVPVFVAAVVAIAPHVQAATIQVDIAAFQYAPSGWATADPINLTAGAGTTTLPVAPPTVSRGDTISFANRDPLPHTVTKVSGPSAGSWTALSLGPLGNATLTISSTFPLGTYIYRCTLHQGMRGSFTVA